MNSKPLRKNIMVFSLVVLLVLVTRYFVAAEEIPPTIKDKILESVGTHSAEVFVYKQKLAPLTVIKPLFNTEENSNSLTIEVTGFSWLFIADAYPCTSFAHPIEVGIIDEKTQDIQKKNYLWWPIIHEPNAQWHALRYFLKHEQEQYNNLLQSNIPMCNPQDNVICCDSPLAPSSWVSQSMPGSKPNFWAVVIAGGLATGDELF